MIKSMVLAWYGGYNGGQIGDLLSQLEQTGFFSYVLPFLLIFAVIFGLLTRMKLFTQKENNKPNNSINAVIAFVIGLMALQFDLVPRFFAEVFPRLGVGLSIILVMIIIVGLFAPNQSWMTYAFFGIAVIIFVSIIVKSSNTLGFYTGGGYIWDQYGALIIVGIVLLIFIATITGASKPDSQKDLSSKFMNILFGNNN